MWSDPFTRVCSFSHCAIESFAFSISFSGSSPTFYFKPHRTKISTVRLTDSVVLTASEFTTIKIWDLYSLLKTPIQKGAELLARIKFDLLPLRILDLRFWSDTKLGVITLSGADRICNDRYVQFRDVSIPCPKFNPAKESELGPDAASNYYARARASRDTETGWWDSEEEVEQNGGTPLEIELQDMVL